MVKCLVGFNFHAPVPNQNLGCITHNHCLGDVLSWSLGVVRHYQTLLLTVKGFLLCPARECCVEVIEGTYQLIVVI